MMRPAYPRPETISPQESGPIIAPMNGARNAYYLIVPPRRNTFIDVVMIQDTIKRQIGILNETGESI